MLTSDTPGSALADLKSEHSRQREQAKTGSRIAATLGALGDYASGLTLIFADGKASFGILTLLRTREMGPFTSSEIAMLGLALESGSERLSLLRLHAGVAARSAADLHDDRPSTDDVRDGESYVLDQDLQIVMTWTSQHERRAVLTGLRTRLAERLPAVLEDTVRALIAGWRNDPVTHLPGVARPVPFLVVHTEPVSGPTGLFIGVRIDRFQSPNSLAGPAARFLITPRELEVLVLMLEGAAIKDIGKALSITTSTVHGHIASMVEKTKSRNRTELIARVLGWEGSPDA